MIQVIPNNYVDSKLGHGLLINEIIHGNLLQRVTTNEYSKLLVYATSILEKTPRAYSFVVIFGYKKRLSHCL